MFKRVIGFLFLFLLAGATPAAVVPFTIDATSLGGSKFEANFLDFSYQAEVDSLVNAFSVSSVLFFGSARKDLGAAPIANTGIGNAFNLYATTVGQGTLNVDAAGNVISTFDSFGIQIWADPKRDTTTNSPTPGLAGGNELKSRTGHVDDDILLATGELIKGEAIRHPGQSRGAFNIEFHLTSFPNPSLLKSSSPYPIGTLTGVNSFDFGIVVPPGLAFDQISSGSGNISAVPEPTMWMLMAAGLVGMIGVARRKLS